MEQAGVIVLGGPSALVAELIAADPVLREAAPLALLASINGVDRAGRKYILRLDQGDFDLGDYLRKLSAAGYRGPVGLQGYSVPGEPRENLSRSMEAWRNVCEP